MKKLFFVGIAILALLVVVAPAAAGGGKWVNAQKAPFYKVAACSSDNVLSELAGGQVVLVNPMGSVSLVVQGNVKGLDPSAGYDVWIRDLDLDPANNVQYTGPYIVRYERLGYYKLTTFTTDGEGNAAFHLNLRADHLPGGVYEIQVAINSAEVQGCTKIATQWPGLSVTVKSR